MVAQKEQGIKYKGYGNVKAHVPLRWSLCLDVKSTHERYPFERCVLKLSQMEGKAQERKI